MSGISVPAPRGAPWLDRALALRDRVATLRDRLVANPRFRRWAAAFPLTRPIARRPGLPSAASRRSTTIWVAMPAWSVPGCHSASRPCIRRQRTRVSWMVMVSAWPICRLPVTLGGGIMTVKGAALLAGSAAKAPERSQPS